MNYAYEVIPRYSAGSPAMVSGEIANRVIRDEKAFYEHALEGVYGEEEKKKAEAEGLEGIVLKSEKGSQYRDVITGRDYGDMPYTAIRHGERLTAVRHLRGRRGSTVDYYIRRRLIVSLPYRASLGEEQHAGEVMRELLQAVEDDAGRLWAERHRMDR